MSAGIKLCSLSVCLRHIQTPAEDKLFLKTHWFIFWSCCCVFIKMESQMITSWICLVSASVINSVPYKRSKQTALLTSTCSCVQCEASSPPVIPSRWVLQGGWECRALPAFFSAANEITVELHARWCLVVIVCLSVCLPLSLAVSLMGFCLFCFFVVLFLVVVFFSPPPPCCCGPHLLPILLQSEASNLCLPPLVCPNPPWLAGIELCPSLRLSSHLCRCSSGFNRVLHACHWLANAESSVTNKVNLHHVIWIWILTSSKWVMMQLMTDSGIFTNTWMN